MPDHLHFLAEGTEAASDLQRLVKGFRIKSSRCFLTEWKAPLWQKRFYDRILRSPDSVESVAWYIWLNPVRKRLVANPEEYVHSGSLL
jgi:REP element-mobilizing transposase RayT